MTVSLNIVSDRNLAGNRHRGWFGDTWFLNDAPPLIVKQMQAGAGAGVKPVIWKP
jgi:hypothetical protein